MKTSRLAQDALRRGIDDIRRGAPHIPDKGYENLQFHADRLIAIGLTVAQAEEVEGLIYSAGMYGRLLGAHMAKDGAM